MTHVAVTCRRGQGGEYIVCNEPRPLYTTTEHEVRYQASIPPLQNTWSGTRPPYTTTEHEVGMCSIPTYRTRGLYALTTEHEVRYQASIPTTEHEVRYQASMHHYITRGQVPGLYASLQNMRSGTRPLYLLQNTRCRIAWPFTLVTLRPCLSQCTTSVIAELYPHPAAWTWSCLYGQTYYTDGTKLKPMIIFKGKTMPKVKFPAGMYVHVQENGWMDEEGVRLWLEHIWSRRPGGLRKERSLLVRDMFRSHLTEPVKNA
ncbi:Pogo transposable element-like 49 [Homarus americanus]|uniref:Pogo transposable element-like 49 n=1 Tax=Homarus americanus TaxID=6706 RepID=A0A8J5N2N5_HOMAM|nr:Pogo transposable element-like 49 [Homarus americanus]